MALVNTITGISPEALMYPQPGDGRLCVMKVFVGTKQTLEYLLQYRNRKLASNKENLMPNTITY